MQMPRLLYGIYERRLAATLTPGAAPHHVGVILDGNRRWARSAGESAGTGHRRGADKISEFLQWCEDVGVQVVTLWMLSTDNLQRPQEELAELLGIIEDAVTDLASSMRWQINPVGALDLLPELTAQRVRAAAELTANVSGIIVNIAVGYGGRREIADAVRAMLLERAQEGMSLEEIAETIDVDHIAEHLYTKGQPDPDLVIRTSGEQRLSGFMLWQSVHTEFYFCEAYWPNFRRVDFLRALRSYAARERRRGK